MEVEGEESEREEVGGAREVEKEGVDGCTAKGGTVAMGTEGREVGWT